MPGDHADYEEFVPVCTIDNAALVPLACSLLDSIGVRYFIRNDRDDESLYSCLLVFRRERLGEIAGLL